MKKLAFALLALAPLTTALADEGAGSDPVETLKASLTSSMGFEVDNVRMTDDGVACISYQVSNDLGGKSRAQAVVQGDEVLNSTSRSAKFAKAWNSKCARRDKAGD